MFTEIKHCDKKLNFSPFLTWPASMPAIAYQGELWSGFDLPETHPVYNWTSGHPLQIFKSLYPELSMVEVARIAKLESAHIPQKELFQAYGFQYLETTQQIFAALYEAPLEFQNWLAQKTVGPQELGIFLSISPSKLNKALAKIVAENHSRSQGVQILELYGELLMMGQTEEVLLGAQGDEWFKLLRQLRYPQSHTADKLASQQVAKIPWPSAVQSKWTRKGDKAGVEIKFFAGNPMEFKRTLASLRKLEESFGEDNLW